MRYLLGYLDEAEKRFSYHTVVGEAVGVSTWTELRAHAHASTSRSGSTASSTTSSRQRMRIFLRPHEQDTEICIEVDGGFGVREGHEVEVCFAETYSGNQFPVLLYNRNTRTLHTNTESLQQHLFNYRALKIFKEYAKIFAIIVLLFSLYSAGEDGYFIALLAFIPFSIMGFPFLFFALLIPAFVRWRDSSKVLQSVKAAAAATLGHRL